MIFEQQCGGSEWGKPCWEGRGGQRMFWGKETTHRCSEAGFCLMMCSIQLVLLKLSAREEGWEGWRRGVTLGSEPMSMVWGLALNKARAHWWALRRGEMWIRTTVPTPQVRWTHRKGFLLPLFFLLLFLFTFLSFLKFSSQLFPLSHFFLSFLPASSPAGSSFSFLSYKASPS